MRETEMNKTWKRTTTTTYRYELYHDDILTFDWSSVPEDAYIGMRVSGGGDWSSCDLDTTDEPLIISWIETEHDPV